MSSSPVAWVNRRLLPFSRALHGTFDHVVSYGTGVFEGIRVYGENVWLLREHVARLRESARLYGMSYSFTDDQLIRAILDVVRLNTGHTYIRPVVFRGEGVGVNTNHVPVNVGIASFAWGKYVADHLYQSGASVLVTNRLRPPHRMFPFGAAKGGSNYGAWSVPAKEDANAAQASEGLLQGEDQHGEKFILDGSGMNLAIVEGGRIVTPEPTRWNILHGLTLQFLMTKTQGKDRLDWNFGDISLERLLKADEVFLLGTATEVTPVTLIRHYQPWGSITQAEVGNGKPGQITVQLKGILAAATSGQREEYRKYLTSTTLQLA